MKIFNQCLVWSYIMLPVISFLLLPHLAMAVAKAQMERTKLMANALHNKIAADLAKHRRYATAPHLLHNNNLGHNLLNLRPRRKLENEKQEENISNPVNADVMNQNNILSSDLKILDKKDPQMISFSMVQTNDDNRKDTTLRKNTQEMDQDDSNMPTMWNMNGFGGMKQNDNVIRQAAPQDENQQKSHNAIKKNAETVGCGTNSGNDYMNPYAYFQRAADELADFGRKNMIPKAKIQEPMDDNRLQSMPPKVESTQQQVKAANPNPEPTLNTGFSHAHTTTHFVNMNSKSPQLFLPFQPIPPRPVPTAKPAITVILPINYQLPVFNGDPSMPLPTKAPLNIGQTSVVVPGFSKENIQNVNGSQLHAQSFGSPAIIYTNPTLYENGIPGRPVQQALSSANAASAAQSSAINGNGNIILQKQLVGESQNSKDLGAFQWVPNENIASFRLKRQISTDKSDQMHNHLNSDDDPCPYPSKWKTHDMKDQPVGMNQMKFKDSMDESFLDMKPQEQEMEKTNSMLGVSPFEQSPMTETPNMSPLSIAQGIIKIVDHSIGNKGNMGGSLLLGKKHEEPFAEKEFKEDMRMGMDMDEDVLGMATSEPNKMMDSNEGAAITSSSNTMPRINMKPINDGDENHLNQMDQNNKNEPLTTTTSMSPEVNNKIDRIHDSAESPFQFDSMSKQEQKTLHILLHSDIPPQTAFKAIKYIHKMNKAVESTQRPAVVMQKEMNDEKFESVAQINSDSHSDPMSHSIKISVTMPKNTDDVNIPQSGSEPSRLEQKGERWGKMMTNDQISMSQDQENPIQDNIEEQKNESSMSMEKMPTDEKLSTFSEDSPGDVVQRMQQSVHFSNRNKIEDEAKDVARDETKVSETIVGNMEDNIETETKKNMDVEAVITETDQKELNVPIKGDWRKTSIDTAVLPESKDVKLDIAGTPSEYTKSQLRRAMQFIIDFDKDVKDLSPEQKEKFIRQEMMLISILMDETAQSHDDNNNDNEETEMDTVTNSYLFQASQRFPHGRSRRSIRSNHTKEIVLQYSRSN